MHPAPSIIFFTVSSGLGFGLMAWIGTGFVAPFGAAAAACDVLAIALAAAGLLASLFHLGHPERFLRALTQWRSSWLSREGVLAVSTIIVFGLFSFISIVFQKHPAFLGPLAALLALATVFCTAMIYAQMRTVPRWNTLRTPAIFLLSALAGGAIPVAAPAAPLLLAALGVLQIVDWRLGDTTFQRSGTNLSSATGLATSGTVRSLAPPHTGSNYLLREMVFVLARSHAFRLRIAAIALACVVPAALLAVVRPGTLSLTVAFLSHSAGLLVSRWLFFAQAEHVVGLYYGRR